MSAPWQPWRVYPYTTTVHITHPCAGVFQARMLHNNQEGANTERYVFAKLSARRVQCRPFGHRWHHPNCGDIGHGKSTQVCGKSIHRRIRHRVGLQRLLLQQYVHIWYDIYDFYIYDACTSQPLGGLRSVRRSRKGAATRKGCPFEAELAD